MVAHPLIRTLLKWKWEAFGKVHFLRRLLTYLFVLCLYSYGGLLSLFSPFFESTISNVFFFFFTLLAVGVSVATSGRILSKYTEAMDYVRAAFEIIVLIFAVTELYGEINEFRGGGNAFVDLDQMNAVVRLPMRLVRFFIIQQPEGFICSG